MSDFAVLGTINPNSFMLSVVGLTALSAVLLVLNLLSLKHRSTSRACVGAACVVLLGCVVSNFAVGVLGSGYGVPVLETWPGRAGLALLALAFLGAVFGLIQMAFVPRFRRGRKRGAGTLVLSILAISLLARAEYKARHPPPPAQESDEGLIPLDPMLVAPLPTPKAKASPVPGARATPPSRDSSPD